ncbi:flavodoxin [Bacteroides salyersiae]|uniref:flavodoxin n=1 Tax=Bacteroides salyersiae TaxID=291644 RepID=UPI001C8B39B9|nr:flavodoxin [Bacteroides salyersiae]
MKKIIYTLVLLLAPALGPVTYAQGKTSNEQNMKENKKTLVAFFSRTGENYAVGNIEKGNTHIVAEMIAGKTRADIFQIETVNPYPDEYKACVEIAKTEKENNARPEVKGDVKVEDYDIIFLGYPNWWGDMPMAIYTFIEKHNWNGKTVVPFCTHEGSGLSGTERKLKDACKGATVSEGLAIKGTTTQNSQPQALKTVQTWLKKVNK